MCPGRRAGLLVSVRFKKMVQGIFVCDGATITRGGQFSRNTILVRVRCEIIRANGVSLFLGTLLGANGMSKVAMTEAMARGIATDAANARMRAAGRAVWNRADYNLAVRELNRLCPATGVALAGEKAEVLPHIGEILC